MKKSEFVTGEGVWRTLRTLARVPITRADHEPSVEDNFVSIAADGSAHAAPPRRPEVQKDSELLERLYLLSDDGVHGPVHLGRIAVVVQRERLPPADGTSVSPNKAVHPSPPSAPELGPTGPARTRDDLLD